MDDFSRLQKKICEANLTKVLTVDKEQQWAKGSPGVLCQSNYKSRDFRKHHQNWRQWRKLISLIL